MFNEITHYLRAVKGSEGDKCHICQRTYAELRNKMPIRESEGIIETPIVMIYRLSHPICAGCYATVYHEKEFIAEIMKSDYEELKFGD